MKTRLFFSCCLYFIIGSFSLFSQEQLGLRVDNFSGVNGIVLNPAANLTSPFRFDINLASAGFFIDNNYGHIRNTHLFHFIKNSQDPDNLVNAVYTPNDVASEDSWLLFDYFDNDKLKYASASMYVMGPSFSIKLNNGYSFSFISALRGAGSTHRLPPNAAFYHIDRTPFGEAIDIAPINAAGMVWSEFGINFAPAFYTYNGKLSFGITAKYLTGYEGAFVETPRTLQITQFPGDTILLENSLVNFGFTDSNTNTDIDPAIRKNGQGFSFDVGAVMTIEGDEEGYIWRLGASIVDIGKINFSKNTQLHQIDQSNVSALGILPLDNYSGLSDFSDYANLFSDNILGDSLASRTGDRFSIGLPTALSLQADYQFYPNLYVNTTLVQRLKFNAQAIGRDNIFAITPRYSSRWISASLSLILRNYQQVRTGFSVRLAWFILGSDNLGSWVGKSTFTGTDFFFGLKVNPFRTGPWNFSSGGGKGTKCYDF